MTDLTNLTIKDALEGLEKKDFTAVELTQAHIDAMDATRDLNAYITETPDIALKQAKASDERRSNGDAGLLEGIPLAVKDMFCTKNARTTAASKMLENYQSPYESTVTEKLWNNGAIMLGKTNLDEFAMGASNMTSYYGNVISPWKSNADDRDLVPGGSSGGSAACVAARAAMGSLGTDTNGSIRQPAAFTGTVGIKPTYGRCSRWGIVAFASSLDQAGVFARTVEDTALLLQSCSGHDPKDSTSANMEVPDWASLSQEGIKGMKIGVPKEFRVDGMPDDIENLWQQGADWLKDAGAELVEVSMPHAKYAIPAYYIVAPAEASSNLARYDGVRYGLRVEGKDLTDMYELTRADGFGDEVKRRIMMGTYVLSAGYYDAYYIKAQKIRRLIVEDFKTVFEQCDALLTPTSPGVSFPIGERMDDPIKMYLEDIFTSPASLAGMPAMSVPGGLNKDGLPLGLQIMGKPWDEESVFRVGREIERAANFSARPNRLIKVAA